MQKGDKVELILTGRKGVVTDLGLTCSEVKLDTGEVSVFDNSILKVIEPVYLPREISFEEIQVGDKIRTTASLGDLGTVMTTTGTVGRLSGKEAFTNDHQRIFVADNSAYSEWKIELLERPEPVKVNPYTEAGLHSIATDPTEGVGFFWIKEAADTWRGYSKDGKWANRYSTTTDAELQDDRYITLSFKA